MSTPFDSTPNFGAGGEGDAFAAAIQEVRGEKSWYEKIEWRKLAQPKGLYIITGCLSFVFLAFFGVVSIVVANDCIVDQPYGRCCGCLEVNESRVVGQTMSYNENYNSVFYGIVMIINSGFGFWYIWVGIKTENKYQLLCMLVTQFLEVLRALFDTWFETNPALQSRAVIRQILAYGSLVLMIISAATIPKMFKTWGWNLFRKGGVLKPVRENYKLYQMFRAFNRLDVQSSALLFIIFGLYLQFTQSSTGFWVWWVLLACDLAASRYCVKYLKQEEYVGFIISMIAKLYVVIWWIVICVDYSECRVRYWASLVASREFWKMNPYPSFASVRASYNGVDCLAPQTAHDDRTLELIFLNLAQALVFRIGSMVYGVFVARKFGNGLKGIFYRELAIKTEIDDAKKPEGGKAIKFVPKKKKSSATAAAAAAAGSSEASMADQEMSSQKDMNTVAAASDYEQYDESAEEEGEGQAPLEEDGITEKEMRDDLAW